MAATSPSRWPRSPSQGKCSRAFYASSQNYGRSLRLRQHEVSMVMRSRATDRRSASKCQGKRPNQPPLPPFGLSGTMALVRAATLSCENAGKSQKCTQDRSHRGIPVDSVSSLDLGTQAFLNPGSRHCNSDGRLSVPYRTCSRRRRRSSAEPIERARRDPEFIDNERSVEPRASPPEASLRCGTVRAAIQNSQATWRSSLQTFF